jgi:4-hydroxy-tetrahydrodipicolinate synthase
VPAPFGFPLSQAELGGHLSRVAATVGIPVVAYNVPSRVHVTLEPALLARLAADGVLQGVKDSSGDLPKGRVMCELTRDLPNFVRYTGTEQSIDSALLGGFDASMAGLANLFPHFHVELTTCASKGDWIGAAAAQRSIVSLLELYDGQMEGASFAARFFAVVKEALVQLGVIRHNTTAVPFRSAGEPERRAVEVVVRRAEQLRP